jgi:acetyl-CoA acetyltransferase
MMPTDGGTFDTAKVAVLGIGYSRITRDALPPDVTVGDECIEACRTAIADAGLRPEDIDGITSFVNYAPDDRDAGADGVTMVTPQYVWRRLGLDLRWGEVNNKFVGASLIEAHNAIAGGACRFALVWRAVDLPRTGRVGAASERLRATGADQFSLPYGSVGGYVYHSPTAQRYFHRFGATRDHMARFVVRNRKHALMNEKSYWSINRPEPMSVDDYLSSRMIAEPLCLYDCDIPVRGCVAYVLGPAEAAQDLSHRAAFVKAIAQAWIGPRGPETFFHAGGRLLKPSLEDNADLPPLFRRHLWEPAGLQPSDMSTANVYDGFSILAWLWLEALGFCDEGEAFEYVQGDHNEIGGSLPLNTSGGHLGEGALAGAPHYSEAVLQCMGRAGVRQVPNVRYALAATDRPTRAQVIIFSAERD